MSLPKFLKIGDLANWLTKDTKESWRTERVVRILSKSGIAIKRGGMWYVRPEDLTAHWPEAFETILERLKSCQVRPHGLANRTREKGTRKWSPPLDE